MAKSYRRQNQDKFGARRRLRQLQREQKKKEAALGITARIVRDTVESADDPDSDLLSEKVFEREMEKGFKRED